MARNVRCPNSRCGVTQTIPEAEVGRKRCPRCKEAFLVDTESGASPAPVTPVSKRTLINRDLPEQFGRYRILRKLGRGGMGTVYLAQDTKRNRQVALKVPHIGSKNDSNLIVRFLREARAAGEINHPNICQVYDSGQINGVQYLAMAFIKGERLSRYTKEENLLPQRSVAKLVAKAALALHEAHRRGILHRDLKPSNIMLDGRREPVIMDFGLALQLNKDEERLTRAGETIGTPAYMAPEQLRNMPAESPTVDVYSLGIILFELLTGQVPFEGGMVEILGQIITDAPTPFVSTFRPDVHPALEAICQKAIAREARERFASMAELATALKDFVRRNPRSGATPEQADASGGQEPAVQLGTKEMLVESGLVRHLEKEEGWREKFAASWKRWLPWGLGAIALLCLVAYLLNLATHLITRPAE